MDRRTFLTGVMAGAVAVACGSDDDADTPTTTTGEAPTTSGSTATTASADAVESTEPTDTTDTTDAAATAADGWANGGTDLITVDFPDDAIFATAAACSVSLTEATTLGPCYFADDTGEDISEGLTGLPMQLCLQVIDQSCAPIEGLTVEVWHCDHAGVYSGDTSESADASSFAGDFCTGGDTAAASSSWYRGQLTSDASGRVNFKTCFPGWYGGRTLHFHFAVSDGSGTRVISQLTFEDALATEVYTTHPVYSPYGDQDTPLSSGTDSVFPSSGFESFIASYQQNSDGTLLGYHVIQVT